MFLRRIGGLWTAISRTTGEIEECFDTKAEANDFITPYRLKEALKEFDKHRTWKSLYDVEQGAAA